MDERQKNYDIPFENKVDEEFDEYYDIEDLHNTEYGGINQIFPPGGSFTNLPADVFVAPDLNQQNILSDYRRFTEYEDLENLK